MALKLEPETAMTAPLKAIDGNADLPALMTELAARARAAARVLALASPEQKNRALDAIARAIRSHAPAILAANAEDVAEVRAGGATSAFIDRLTLTPARIEAMAEGVATVRGITDPVGAVTERWQRPNGMTIERVRVPLGVIAVIFESRPNVAADAGVLCLKSGNAVILRGGSDSFRSCRAIHDCLVQGLREAGLPEASITLVPTRDRAAVGLLLTGLNGGVDVIVPRGGKSLVARVEAEARVPVFAHLEGVNHVYVDRSANLEMAKKIVLNAKMRRPGVCGAAETLLVDRAGASTSLKPLVEMLIEAGCEVRGDAAVQRVDARVKPASEEDWATEYEDAIISARVVDGLDDAIAHIHAHGSHHTDAIVTEDAGTAEKFLNEVDSAIVLHNASTQFADGGEFGFGAEIGIATGKFHARGPVGAEQLTSFKYRVRGTGQTRP
jgi:glutamate-5-semialdehyde dehydrogenase